MASIKLLWLNLKLILNAPENIKQIATEKQEAIRLWNVEMKERRYLAAVVETLEKEVGRQSRVIRKGAARQASQTREIKHKNEFIKKIQERNSRLASENYELRHTDSAYYLFFKAVVRHSKNKPLDSVVQYELTKLEKELRH